MASAIPWSLKASRLAYTRGGAHVDLYPTFQYTFPMSNFSNYFQKIAEAAARGDATEHTHRPALKALIESMAQGVLATNEPKRIDCGAPDYIVTRGETLLGYVEAKDVGVSLR